MSALTTRSYLIKRKLIDTINELTATDAIEAIPIYVENKSQHIGTTLVYPIEESTKYEYSYEDGFKTFKNGTTFFLLGGNTFLNHIGIGNDDASFQQYSLILDKLETKLIDKEQHVLTNGSQVIDVQYQLVDSSCGVIANEKKIVFNIRVKAIWRQKK